jgi:hypothetical protein
MRAISQKLWAILVVRDGFDIASMTVLHLEVQTAPRQVLRGTLANLCHPLVFPAGTGGGHVAVLSLRKAMGTTWTFRLCRARRNCGDALMV